MSIRPQYADAILAGSKLVEFRKRRLGADVTNVAIYATLPVGAIVGTFEVLGHDVAPPAELWNRHHAHAGISIAGFDAYYDEAATAVGILIGSVQLFSDPRPVSALPGAIRPPQSFSYLTTAQADEVQSWTQVASDAVDAIHRATSSTPVVARILERTLEVHEIAGRQLPRAV